MPFLRVNNFRDTTSAQAYIISGICDLQLDSVGQGNSAFGAYDPEPPPPPKLKSRGVIAMDITEQFAQAAQRMPFSRLSITITITC